MVTQSSLDFCSRGFLSDLMNSSPVLYSNFEAVFRAADLADTILWDICADPQSIYRCNSLFLRSNSKLLCIILSNVNNFSVFSCSSAFSCFISVFCLWSNLCCLCCSDLIWYFLLAFFLT